MPETFTAILDNTGTLQQEAVLEQLAGLCAIYWGYPADAQALLDLCGGGVIDVWFFDPVHPVTDLALVHQGQHYYVWISGTVNPQQWVGNIQGSLYPLEFSPDVLVNAFFWNTSQTILAAAAGRLPVPGPGVRITLVGHSLGGAVAQILALQLQQVYGADAIDVLTFGQPRTFTLGLNGPMKWPHYQRIWIPSDPVARLPPTGEEMTILMWATAGQLASVPYSWTHYGVSTQLQPGAGLVPDPGDGWFLQIPLAWMAKMDPNSHVISNYAAAAWSF